MGALRSTAENNQSNFTWSTNIKNVKFHLSDWSLGWCYCTAVPFQEMEK